MMGRVLLGDVGPRQTNENKRTKKKRRKCRNERTVREREREKTLCRCGDDWGK